MPAFGSLSALTAQQQQNFVARATNASRILAAHRDEARICISSTPVCRITDDIEQYQVKMIRPAG